MKYFLFWLSTLGRVDKVSKDADALIRRCIWLIENYPSVNVIIDHYYITIQTSENTIRLWNANKFYGWLSLGSVDKDHFHGIMPSRRVSFKFKKCLEKHGYNIYQKEKHETISTTTIKP